MKNVLILLFAALLFQACDNTETNTAALQANIQADFFKAFAATATMDADDLSITITGQSDDQQLVLHTEWRGQKKYHIGLDAKSYASFTDSEGNVVSTDSEGSEGTITITGRSDNRQEVSGKFEFNCVIPGKDTIVVHKGLFYAVPYTIVDNSTED